MGRSRAASALLIALLVFLGCSDADDADTTTTTIEADASTTTDGGGDTDGTATRSNGGTTAQGTDDAAAAVETTTTTIDPTLPTIPDYQIQARIVGEAGDTVVVFIQPATYTDLDIENVVADVVTRFAPITTVHVVDDPEVVDLVLSDEAALTPEEVADRDAHYFARLEEGFRLVFEGPFESVPEAILGS